MPYMKEECVAGNTIEINKYHCYRYPNKGEKGRAKKRKETCEAQKKVNLRKLTKKLRRLMNANFQDGDYLVRLDFSKMHIANDSKEMQEYMQKFTRNLRYRFKREDMELKYIYVKEVGPRGGRHVHMIMSKCDTDWIRKCWPYGGIHLDPLYSNGQYRKIAEYFVKYASRTEETEGKIIGKRYYPSRNLVKPIIKKRVIGSSTFRENVKQKEGYYLEKESLYSGISEWSGHEYFSYTLIKTEHHEVRGG